MIKIAIPTRDNVVDDHFGHCDHYTVFTIDNEKNVIWLELLLSLHIRMLAVMLMAQFPIFKLLDGQIISSEEKIIKPEPEKCMGMVSGHP